MNAKSNTLENAVTVTELAKAFTVLGRKSDDKDLATVHFAAMLLNGADPLNVNFLVTKEMHESLGKEGKAKHPVDSNAAAAFLAGDRTVLLRMLFPGDEGAVERKQRASTITDAARVARSMQSAIKAGMARIEQDYTLTVQWKAFVGEKDRKGAADHDRSVMNAWVKLGSTARTDRTVSWNVPDRKPSLLMVRNSLAAFKRAWNEQRAVTRTTTAKPLNLTNAAMLLAERVQKSTHDNENLNVKIDDEANPITVMIQSIAENDGLWSVMMAARRQVEAVREGQAETVKDNKAAAKGTTHAQAKGRKAA